MKFFSLIKEGQIHAAPGVKVILKEEFSQLIEAEEILKKAKHEVEEFKKQTHDECEKLKEQAYEDGFQKGLEELNEKILLMDREIKKIHEEVQKKIIPLSLQAARKILGEELQLNPERIVEIVSQALKPVTQHRHIKIYVNKADLEILDEKKSKLKKNLEQVETFSIQERSDIEPGGCVIETEGGIINAQLENQWRALEAAFEAFLKKR
ncbi:MAG: HrpE/YscL family type III secretion apparatus protein [Chlamydiae bacterium CG10_big_fil_rev_8_21_14_0_10_35_9]|nr:MAG: HrpE/YscL family type III secretion apparatus protein [Chlamydiae bacterium CG10_big_fil_rev_8_21_14_0_10_35_9]